MDRVVKLKTKANISPYAQYLHATYCIFSYTCTYGANDNTQFNITQDKDHFIQL